MAQKPFVYSLFYIFHHFFLSRAHALLYKSVKSLVAAKSNYLSQLVKPFLKITNRDDREISLSVSPSFHLSFFPCDDKRLRARSKLDYSLPGWFLEVSVPRDSLQGYFEFRITRVRNFTVLALSSMMRYQKW